MNSNNHWSCRTKVPWSSSSVRVKRPHWANEWSAKSQLRSNIEKITTLQEQTTMNLKLKYFYKRNIRPITLLVNFTKEGKTHQFYKMLLRNRKGRMTPQFDLLGQNNTAIKICQRQCKSILLQINIPHKYWHKNI